MSVAEWLALGVLGGLLGLDTVSFPQAMISRPLVACTVTGAFLGQPMAGLLLGALAEAFALETLPVGASRYPEWGAASVVGGALVARDPAWHEGTLLLALIATLVTGWLGGWSMVRMREHNAAWARARAAGLRAGDPRVVVGLQVHGLMADFVRGATVTLVASAVLFSVFGVAARRWSLEPALTRAVLVALGGIMAAGAVHKVFHGVSHTRWYFLAGALIGLAGVWYL